VIIPTLFLTLVACANTTPELTVPPTTTAYQFSDNLVYVQEVSPDEPAIVEIGDGASIHIPMSSFDETLTVRIERNPAKIEDLPELGEDFMFLGDFYEFSIFGGEVDGEVELTFPIDVSLLPDGPGQLVVLFPNTDSWDFVPVARDGDRVHIMTDRYEDPVTAWHLTGEPMIDCRIDFGVAQLSETVVFIIDVDKVFSHTGETFEEYPEVPYELYVNKGHPSSPSLFVDGRTEYEPAVNISWSTTMFEPGLNWAEVKVLCQNRPISGPLYRIALVEFLIDDASPTSTSTPTTTPETHTEEVTDNPAQPATENNPECPHQEFVGDWQGERHFEDVIHLVEMSLRYDDECNILADLRWFNPFVSTWYDIHYAGGVSGSGYLELIEPVDPEWPEWIRVELRGDTLIGDWGGFTFGDSPGPFIVAKVEGTVPVQNADPPFQFLGELTCQELREYEWHWNGASSGEYETYEPISGGTRPMIFAWDVLDACPDFELPPDVDG